MRYLPSILLALCGAFFVAVPLCILRPVDAQTGDMASMIILLGALSLIAAYVSAINEAARAHRQAQQRPPHDGSRGPRRGR